MHDADKICYGMLYRQDVKLISQSMLALVTKLQENAGTNTNHVQKFKLTPKAVHVLLSLPDGSEFGYLRPAMTKALVPLLEKGPAIEVEAVAVTSHLCQQISHATKPEEALVQVNINIYGPQNCDKEIGDMLSDQKLWLQRPDHMRAKVIYKNPHALSFPEIEGYLQEEQVAKEVAAASKPRAEEERLKILVKSVENALSRASELDNETGDQRLTTELLKHQQRALSYMLQRESGEIPEKYRLWEPCTFRGQDMYIHRITKTRSIIRPEEKGGGVLADEMGMGKSLSTLALILRTLEAGIEWAEHKRTEEHVSAKARRPSHSTLVIVPSASRLILIYSRHCGDVLKTVKYHGHSRKKDLDVLEKSDIVITTYNTLAIEYALKKSVLHKIHWYRVVLDEAHIIRRPATTFHRTCADLDARSRWCLTGTPIQNRLDDIGALFSFLRAEQFKSLAQFRRFISTPFDNGDPVVKDRLVLLYDSLCLRRTKDILDLPGHVERIRELDLNESERLQYDKTLNILNRYMRTQVGRYHDETGHTITGDGQSWKGSKFGLFQAHLQLRILCNHGTFQKPFSWKKRDLKDEQSAEREAVVGEFGLKSEVMCDGCQQPRPILGSTHAQNNFVENCAHSLCSDCLEDCSELTGMQDMRHCPLCQRFQVTLTNASAQIQDTLTQTEDGDVQMQDVPDNDVARDEANKNTHHKHYFNPNGYSTKMAKLMEDVKKNITDTKSIIFSCWTKTLDLIVRHLEQEKIDYLRIDGDCLLSKRQPIIDRFENDKGVQVLLMTTGTGAFGLNLTAANRIFLIEPQWNPSVENQAIARAIRLRQLQEVQVTRYVIKNTVEQEMRSQQILKRLAADVGFKREADNAGANADHDMVTTTLVPGNNP
ncbi:SNF2 family N-terminal domain-containing protein [Podospora didyma]|uniref:SNF2 family N-terminal domain-containing protein n=1 Tax=Podospora didyma TaxID=330526 RepID=A0AAE0P7Y3_9PEZI|nr:SNF2 family N-terminal domain-containing protein [Podospora didyma]